MSGTTAEGSAPFAGPGDARFGGRALPVLAGPRRRRRACERSANLSSKGQVATMCVGLDSVYIILPSSPVVKVLVCLSLRMDKEEFRLKFCGLGFLSMCPWASCCGMDGL